MHPVGRHSPREAGLACPAALAGGPLPRAGSGPQERGAEEAALPALLRPHHLSSHIRPERVPHRAEGWSLGSRVSASGPPK